MIHSGHNEGLNFHHWFRTEGIYYLEGVIVSEKKTFRGRKERARNSPPWIARRSANAQREMHLMTRGLLLSSEF
jgi:hypothetical protein